ncbi:MAG: hypothetical protein ABFS34_01975 [Gemmatimonadota bacterium]
MSFGKRLLERLKHGDVWRVLAIYLAAGWVALEAIDVLTSVLRLPDWFPAVGLGMLVVGLPIVLATAIAQARSLSSRAEPGISPARAGAEATQPASSPPRPLFPASVGKLLTWKNAIGVGILAFAAWGVFAAAWVAFSGGPRAGAALVDVAADADPDKVAVVPFTVRGGAEYAYLGDAMVNLLTRKLDGAGDLRTVDDRSVLDFLDGREAPEVEPGMAAARRFNAGTWVTGDIFAAGGRLELSAAVYRRGDDEPLSRSTVEGPAEEVLDLVDRMAAGLLAEMGGGPTARVQRIAAVTTDSIDALKAFLEGERLYRRGRFDESTEAFQRAVSIDTAFALAYYRLSLLAEWNLRGDLADWAADRAVRSLDRLADRERELLEALQVRRTGDNERAARLYRSILSLYPEEREALIDLAEILIHAAPLRGGSFAASREAFEQVLSMDPEHSTSLLHLARVAAAEGKLAELDSLGDRFLRINPTGDRALEIATLRAFARGDSLAQERSLAALAQPETSELSIALAAWDVATYARNLDGAERISRLLTSPGRSLGGHTLGHSWLAHVLAARGRLRDARAELDSLSSENPGVAAEFELLLALAPFAVAPDGALEAARARLTALDVEAIPPSGSPSIVFSALDGLHHVIVAYLDGLAGARLGDGPAVDSAAARLREAAVPRGAGSLNLDLAAAVEAEREWLAGEPLPALSRLDGARREVWYGQTMASPYFAQARERFVQAELLFELGRLEEALPWYEHLVELGPFELLYYPMAELRQAQAHARLGRDERAREHYVRFLDLWSNADPELQPLVEDARRALDSLDASAPTAP